MSKVLAEFLSKVSTYIAEAEKHGLVVTGISRVEHLPNNALIDLRVTMVKGGIKKE